MVNDIILDVSPAMFYLDIEEQDNQDGALLESVDVYVTFKDNSDIAGDSSPANTSEVLAFNIPASEFSPDQFGLPATTINMPLSQLLSLVGLSNDDQIYVDDTWTVRLSLNLTDGRIFSDYNAGGIITGGFFNSPFLYLVTVGGGIDLKFSDEGANNINIGAGAVNDGYSADVSVSEDVTDLWTVVDVYAKYVDNNDDGDDFSTDEVMIGSFPRNVFTENTDTDDTTDYVTSVSFTLAEIDGGVAIEDMSVGDEVQIMYKVTNNAGRVLTSAEFPYTVKVPVVSCPVPPLANLEMFVGDYVMEQVSPSIFGYETFGDGNITTLYSLVTDDSQEEPGVALGNTQRAFDAEYLFALGFGNPDTYVAEFNCQSVTFVDGMAPIDGSTGVWCGNVAGIFLGSSAGAGSFDVLDDSEFTLGFLDDVAGECGDPLNGVAIKFTKVD
jgi:hypothetical protein